MTSKKSNEVNIVLAPKSAKNLTFKRLIFEKEILVPIWNPKWVKFFFSKGFC